MTPRPTSGRFTSPMFELRKGGVAFEDGGKLYYVGGERYPGGNQRSTLVGTFR